MADITTVKGDQDVLNLLIDTYGSELGLTGLLPTAQAQVLRRLSLQVGSKVAKGTIEQIRKGQQHKGQRQIDTYEGMTLVFAAIDERLLSRRVDGRPNCFLIPLDELKRITATYQPPANDGRSLEERLARMRDLKARIDSRIERGGSTSSLEDQGEEQPPAPGSYATAIFNNWRRPVHSGPSNIIPGFYQIFRFYKPTRELSNLRALASGGNQPVAKQEVDAEKETGSSLGNYGGSDLGDHIVICELVYIDPAVMECVVVTSERNKYIGTIYINHEDIIFAILQRRAPGSNGVNQRLLSMKLVRRDLAYHSGLMMKVGDTTSRPLCSECLFVRISRRREEHRDLYQEVEELRANAGDGKSVPRESAIARYLTSPPPSNTPYDPAAASWKNVKFVREFPALLKLSTMQGREPNKYRLMREPARTIDQVVLNILGEYKEMALPPYRREDRSPE